MNLQLSKPELEHYIDEQVRLGHFPTPEAVVEAAIFQAMSQKGELGEHDWAAIRRADEQVERATLGV